MNDRDQTRFFLFVKNFINNKFFLFPNSGFEAMTDLL